MTHQLNATIVNCPRCGRDHALVFQGFGAPQADGFNWWAACPERDQADKPATIFMRWDGQNVEIERRRS